MTGTAIIRLQNKMVSLQRINIGRKSFHNPFASQRSKAADPRINALTLSRLSYSRDKDVRNICAEKVTF